MSSSLALLSPPCLGSERSPRLPFSCASSSPFGCEFNEVEVSKPSAPTVVGPESQSSRGGRPRAPSACTWMVSCRTVYSGSSFLSWVRTWKGPYVSSPVGQ